MIPAVTRWLCDGVREVCRKPFFRFWPGGPTVGQFYLAWLLLGPTALALLAQAECVILLAEWLWGLTR